jgi:hypothetical protein
MMKESARSVRCYTSITRLEKSGRWREMELQVPFRNYRLVESAETSQIDKCIWDGGGMDGTCKSIIGKQS